MSNKRSPKPIERGALGIDFVEIERRMRHSDQSRTVAFFRDDIPARYGRLKGIVEAVVPPQHHAALYFALVECITASTAIANTETRMAVRAVGAKVATEAARATGDQARDITRAVKAKNPGLTLEKLRLKVLEARAPVFGKHDDISVSAISRHLKSDPTKKSRNGHN